MVPLRSGGPCALLARQFMDAVLWFWVALATTVVLLVVALASGMRGRRRLHLVAGPLAMVSLVAAVLLTELVSRRYAFDADVKAIHLVCAKIGGLLALPVVLTGLWLWRSEKARLLHRVAVWLFVVATLVATATGVWMFSTGRLV